MWIGTASDNDKDSAKLKKPANDQTAQVKSEYSYPRCKFSRKGRSGVKSSRPERRLGVWPFRSHSETLRIRFGDRQQLLSYADGQGLDSENTFWALGSWPLIRPLCSGLLGPTNCRRTTPTVRSHSG